MSKITHVNPNCLDARFCLPHGEIGNVKYSTHKILACINDYEHALEMVKQMLGSFNGGQLDVQTVYNIALRALEKSY